MELKIIKTDDGSHSIFVPVLNEHYHSTHGAINESKHVFIQNGLHACIQKINQVNILEVGMGTGLNVLLSALEINNVKDKSVTYYGIEANPLSKEVVDQLNYIDELKVEKYKPLFEKIHSENKVEQLLDNFALYKIIGRIQEIELPTEIDLVYFDAFAPTVQPDMWTDDIFLKLNASMKKGGIVVTYCAKGEFKRTLKRCGFEVQVLPGRPGKREMVKGIKRDFSLSLPKGERNTGVR